MSIPAPSRGEVWDLNLDPTMGHKQAESRPVLILSVDIFNEGPADLVAVIPITRTQRNIRWHVPVKPPEGGLVAASSIQCENVCSVSRLRVKRLRARALESTLQQVENQVRILLGL
jgi:mRNA interferase MazF